jgi:hypothetical protein
MNGTASEVSNGESQFWGSLKRQIDTTRARWRRVELTRNVCILGAIVLMLGFAMLAADHWFNLPNLLRIGCATLWAAVAVGGLYWFVVRPLRHSFSDARVAVHIEKSFPEFQNRLVTAVQLGREPNGTSQAFANEVLRDAATVCSQIHVQEAVDVRPMQKSLVLFLALLCLTLIYGSFFTQQFFTSAKRLMLPKAAIAPAYATQVAVQPGNTQIPPASTLAIKATVSGKLVKEVMLEYQFGKGSLQQQKMESTAANVFDWQMPKVMEDVTYLVKAGDYTSPKYLAKVVLRPALNGFNFAFQYPEYTGLKPKSFDAKSGDISAPVGTKVQFTVDVSKPLATAKLALNGDPATLNLKGKQQAAGAFEVQTDGAYSIEVTDTDGVANDPIPTFSIKAIPDEMPTVELVLPGEDLIVAPQDKVSIRVAATDDYALKQVRLRWFFPGEEHALKTFTNWEVKGGEKKANQEYVLDVAATDFKPGQSIIYFAEAVDNAPANGGQVGVSQRLRIDFVTAAQKAGKLEQQEFAAKAKLAKIIEMQEANRDKAMGAQKNLASATQPLIVDLGGKQVDIRKETVTLSESLDASLMACKPTLEALSAREMADAVKAFQSLEGATDAGVLDKGLQAGIAIQTTILEKLQALLTKMSEERRAQEMLSLFRTIDEIIEAQKKVKEATGTTADPPGSEPWKELSRQENRIHISTGEYQSSLEQKVAESAQSNPELSRKFAAINQELSTSKVIALMKAVEKELPGPAPKGTVPNQDTIIAKLEAINKMLKDAVVAQAKEESEKLKTELARMSEKLDKLVPLQTAILERTKEIAKRQDETIKDLGKQQLSELSKVQAKVADVVESIANDLGVLPDYDASNHLNSKMREIWEDVKAAQLAKDQGAVEVAVARDESILEAMKKAGERVKDLEMWLIATPDYIVWNLENFGKDELPQKMPMVDLPDELDDIVGDLIDKENDLFKQMQDMTSNWATPDGEMGWDISEGPMPNFSAKGKTGNQLPNDSEMTGRSGAGRTGKASGELVEDYAKDVGGRDQIPARRTQDPVQKGVVKEENPNSKSHGTGGGKASGFGNEGLTGSTKPVDMQQWQRMATEQEKMRKSAEQLETALKLMQLPTGELKSSIDSMRKVEQQIKDANVQGLKTEQVVLMHKLNNTYRALTGTTTVTFDPTLQLPDEMRQQILDARSTKFQAEYQELVEDYFKSLSEAVAK